MADTPRCAGPSIRPGLCSVTYRDCSVEQVAQLAADAGLESVEWGADVHAPADDPGQLERVRTVTAAAGLTSCSYGGYYRAEPGEDPTALVVAAVALGTPRVRVWAGQADSADVCPRARAHIVEGLQLACDLAAAHGIEVALEFHRRTLTDTVASTLALLAEVERDNLSTYWQPPVGQTDPDALAGLTRVRPQVSTAHVFSWAPDGQRLPLAARADMWRAALGTLASTGRCTDALLEFVPDNDPARLAREAAQLHELLAQTGSVAGSSTGGSINDETAR